MIQQKSFLALGGAILSTLFFPASLTSQDGSQAAKPDKVVNLLSDPKLSEFTHHLNDKSSLTMDPLEIWKISDKGEMLVTGEGMGYLRTKQAYRDYHLVLEYKWGERTVAGRSDRARDCGLLIHAYGPDGAYGNTWMSCIEAQLIEGGSGDFLVLAAKGADGKIAPTSITATVTDDRDGEPVWDPKGEKRTFPLEGKTMARVNWRDRDPDWADVKGFMGPKDIENPLGEWNRLEVICRDNGIKILLNGELINEVTDCNPAAGFIGLQSEYAECHIKRFELHPLDTFKEEWAPEAKSTNMGYSITGESILPRKLPLSPEESAALWEIDGEYELQLVASEPLTCDPVDVVWDEKGRMFVAEMRDYPLPADGEGYLSRIRLLTDKDGDGVMDGATTWADGLDHVQGLLPMNGGLLATTRTAILFLKDTDGDDVADQIDRLFVSNEPRHNQLQISCPRWGLDNAIYLNNGLDAKEIYPEGHEDAKVDVTKLNLRYDPFTREMSPVTGSGQFGGSLDDFNRRFFCSNRNPVMFAVMPLEAVKRTPLAGIGIGHEDIQPPGAPVWPIAISHTTSKAHAGTHTAACGLGVYRGDLIPDLKGNIFVCDPTSQLVTRNQLVQNGASYTAERVGEKKDFLVSGDEWVRPVNVRNGPDGALYVCDMYRRFIDHSRFFPEDFSEAHYMRAGVDQGRIWRLVPKGGKAPAIKALPEATADLVKELESANGWRRVEAHRLLLEKNDKACLSGVKALFTREESSAETKAHALWILEHFKALESSDVLAALSSENPDLVENAIELASRSYADNADVQSKMAELIRNPNARVQFLSLTSFPLKPDSRSLDDLVAMVKADPKDPWMRRALMSSRPDQVGTVLASILGDSDYLANASAAKTELLKDLASLAAANGNAAALGSVIQKLKGNPSWWHFAVVNGLSTGLRKGSLKQKSIAALVASPPDEIGDDAKILSSVLEKASELVLDTAQPAANRVAALPLVAQQGIDKTLPIVDKLIAPAEPASVQEAACRALSSFKRDQVAEFFFERWENLAPTPRREALALITGNTQTGLLLMKKMKAGEIPASVMPPMTRWSYGRSTNEEIKTLANELFGQTDSDRAKVVAEYRAALSEHKGDPEKGKAVFMKAACMTCHQLGGIGVEVGPPLADVRAKPAEALLTDILDPNRAVEERWISTVVENKAGTSLSGLVFTDDDAGITLRLPGGVTQTIPRDEVKKFSTTGLSLMPVGLEAAITKEEMSDLIAFLKAR